MPPCRLLLLAALLAGCGRPAPQAPPRPAIVFATLYPLADIARQVGGDAVRADWLVRLGDPIEAYTLDDRDRTRLLGVDLILADGAARTETWAAREIGRRRQTGTVALVEQTPDAWRAPADGLLYLDPVLAGEYGEYLAKLLTRRQPQQGDLFRARAAAYADELARVAATFTAPTDSKVVVLSDLFLPLLARFDVRPVLVTAEALHFTPSDAEAVRAAAKESGAGSLLVPFDTPPGTRADLEAQTGLKVFAIDALGGPNFQEHETYLEMLRFNLEQLRQATAK